MVALRPRSEASEDVEALKRYADACAAKNGRLVPWLLRLGDLKSHCLKSDKNLNQTPTWMSREVRING